MATLLLAFLVFTLAMLGLAIGLLSGRSPLRGSCGGSACGACEACPKRVARKTGHR